MAGQMTSFDVTWRNYQQKIVSSCRASSGLSNQCKFISLWHGRTKIKRAPYTPLLYHGGGMSKLVCPRVNCTVLSFCQKIVIASWILIMKIMSSWSLVSV